MDYSEKTSAELKEICKERKIKGVSGKNKLQLVELIQRAETAPESTDVAGADVSPPMEVTGGATPEMLELCKIPESLNIEQIKDYVYHYMTPRIPFYHDTDRAPFIEDEFSEYFIAKSSGGTVIGNGNCAMDVQTKDNEGIDVMCVVMNRKQSNEKSIIQNFSVSGVDLDTLFKNEKHEEAVKLYTEQYSKKLTNVKTDKKLTDLYILAFVSTKQDVFLVCFKMNIDNIKHISSGGFVNTASAKNIIIQHFINTSYGNVKLYKSKKRIELRLLDNVLKSEHAVKIYTMPPKATE